MLKKKDSHKTNNKNALAKTKAIPSVISNDMNILGNLISDGYIDINGHIEGNVKCNSLTVREQGVIKGDIFAETVHVHGQVSGIIKAKHVFLASAARVRGVIMHESMSMEEGAFIDGQCKRTDRSAMMDQATQPPQSTTTVHSAAASLRDNIELLENFRIISGDTKAS